MALVVSVMITVMVAVTVTAPPSRAQAVTCPSAPPPEVSVGVVAERPVMDHSRSVAELSRIRTDTRSPYAADIHTWTGGLTRGSIRLGGDIRIRFYRFPGRGLVCAAYAALDLEIRLSATVFIARDYARLSCRYRAVRDHEMKHVDMDRRIALDWVPTIRAGVMQATRRNRAIGPYPDTDLDTIRSNMNTYVRNIMQDLQARLTSDRLARQQGIDSLEEYESVRQKCRWPIMRGNR